VYAGFIGVGATAAYVSTPTEAKAGSGDGIANIASELVESFAPGAKFDPNESLAPVVKRVKPAVVTVFTQGMDAPGVGSMFGPGSPFGDEPRGLGSGFLISADGIVVTNHHVVAHGRKLTVRLDDGRRFEAKVLGSDEQTDIAVIKLEGAKNLPTVKLGSSKRLEVGDWVLAVGSPQGMLQTASVGIVSAQGRGSLNLYGNGSYVDFIQTDAAISRGSSGGPLFNLKGEVIGVNTAVHGMGNGLGFAVPVDQARFVIPQLRNDGAVSRAWLGVTGRANVQPALGAPVRAGAHVDKVHPGTPAAKAGLADGDRILAIDGKSVENFADLRGRVGFTKPGKKVDLKIERDGKQKKLTVQLGKLPQAEELTELSRNPVQQRLPSKPKSKAPKSKSGKGGSGSGLYGGKTPALGIGVEANSDGLTVRDVDEGGLGKQLGLRPGDVLLEVNKKKVRSADDVRKALEGTKKQVHVKSKRGKSINESTIQRW
jgi:serine protease Do